VGGVPDILIKGSAVCVEDPGEDELAEAVPVGESPPPQPESRAAALKHKSAKDDLISSVFLMEIIPRLHYRRLSSRNCRQ
jgi:hypothetical protein